MVILGKCHCGNITFTLTWQPDPAEIPARACGCAFCTKHGAAWTSNPDGALVVAVRKRTLLAQYEFGTRTAQFQVCAGCGIVPVVTCTLDGRVYAVVNVNAFESLGLTRICSLPASFDDEVIAERLARRKRNWIANVSFVGAMQDGSGVE